MPKATVDRKLKYADGDKSEGASPQVTAGAQTNSFAGTKETALFNIDTGTGMLVKQALPNDGILNSVRHPRRQGRLTKCIRHPFGWQGCEFGVAAIG